MPSSADPTEQLARLVQQRVVASSRRVDEVDAAARRAGEALAEARAALIGFERAGGGEAKQRAQLEADLREAEQRTREPWPQRAEGARRAVRDAQHAVAAFVGANFEALVASRERAGEAAAASLNEHARAVVADFAAWAAVVAEIGQLAALVGAVSPGDVSRSAAQTDQLARAAQELLQRGGEHGPRLVRDPRQPKHGAALVEPVSA